MLQYFLQQPTLHLLQQVQDSTYRNIEVVKITKVLPKSKNKQNLETKQSDFTESRCRKIPEILIPEINGIKKQEIMLQIQF